MNQEFRDDPGAGLMSFASLVLVGVWTKARGFVVGVPHLDAPAVDALEFRRSALRQFLCGLINFSARKLFPL